MRLLELWQRLQANEHGADMLPALRELAALDLKQRGPWLPALVSLLGAADAELRAAAIAAFAGTNGVPGLRRIVAALDDDDERVRRAAIAALVVSTTTTPARWAHALFHRRPEVRRAAVIAAPEPARWMLAWARADPSLAALVRDAPWPTDPLPLVADLWRRGALAPEEAATALCIVNVEQLRLYLSLGDRRAPTTVRGFGEAALASSTLPGAVGLDALDPLLEILARAGEAGRAAWGTLLDALLDPAAPDLRLRGAVSACVVAERVGWTESLARLALVADARWLAFGFVPADVRRAAASTVWSHRPAIVAPQDELLRSLLGSALVRDDADRPELRTAAAIASLLGARRLEALLDAFGEEALLERMGADPEAWDAVCRLPLEPDHLVWLARLAELDVEQHARACALAITRWLVGEAEADAAIELALQSGGVATTVALLDRLEQPGHTLAREHCMRLARTVRGVAGDELPRVLDVAAARSHEHELARALLAVAIEHDDAGMLDGWVAGTDPATRRAAIVWLRDVLAPSPMLLESLAQRWREHEDAELRAFSARTLRPQAPPPAPRADVVTIGRLADAVADRIATCELAELEQALGPALALPSFGLAAALARRPSPPAPQLSACAALLACVDGLEPVARELGRFGRDDEGFDEALLHAALALWRGSDTVPPLVDAVLVAFERNAVGFATWLEAEEGGVFGALRSLLELPSSWVRRTCWHAAAQVITGWSWRKAHKRVAAGADDAAIDMLASVLDTEVGTAAARILVALQRTRLVDVERVRARVLGLAPACTRETLHALSSWLPTAGIRPRDAAPRRVSPALPADERSEARASNDVDALAQLCRTAASATVQAAVARLVELGERGCAALAGLLVEHELPFVELVRESIMRWPEGAALARLRMSVDDDALAPARRFGLALALARRGEPRWALRAVELVSGPMPRCVAAEDWQRLLDSGVAQRELVERALAASDPLLVDPAARWVLALPRGDAELDRLLRKLLGEGSAASPALLREAALQLFARGDRCALPWLLGWALDADVTVDDVRKVLGTALPRDDGTLAELLVDIALEGGAAATSEARVVELVQWAPRPVEDAALARLLVDGSDAAARKRIVAARMFMGGRGAKLRELASVFAWGVMRGRELTGRRFSIHITPKREQWGYTHIGSAAIHVTPLPILTGARHGRDIVEGLVLHEIGHHVWHSGKPAARVWKRAQREGLFQLLNLVADEHLERNLRSLDADFGDRIKRLDAHAFQHAARELEVDGLLRMLGAGALAVLAEIGPQVAYADTCLRIDSGRLLAELDRVGNSFARFVRALRMGLGNRAGDPKVNAALAYFGVGFKALDMHGLYRVTRALAELFGDEARLADGFGGHESVEWNERDAEVHGDGIVDADVQREVERILEPPKPTNPSGGVGRLAINVGAAAGYKKITKVQPLAHDPAKHRAVADPVRRHALRLRETLQRLGLAHRRVNARLRGHTLDRTRVRALVTRGDPRILRARELRVASDLFLGVIVDCSGSMSGANLERARMFAVLVAEAARGLPGVEARFYGFTDTVIYEAGDAQRCAASSLESSGGNNDAAALDHVARVAAGSLRRAKLLVMVSDGLPTECSVAALRGVVQELTRRHRMCCAQVAVRALDEICFPHYVLLDDANLDAAVRRFAELIGKLVGRALAI